MASQFLRYSDFLDHQIKTAPKKRKGERTRDRLQWAAACVLEDVGYRNMRISDICEIAEISPATLYLYYENKTELTEAVLTEFIQLVGRMAVSKGPFDDPFDAIHSSTKEMVEIFVANAGIMRCLIQLSEEVPSFAELWRTSNGRWYQRIAHSVSRRMGEEDAPSEDIILFAVYAVGGMVDQFLRDLFVFRNPSLELLIRNVAPSLDDLSELLSIMWYRGIYGCNPPRHNVSVGTDLLRLTLATAGEDAPHIPSKQKA